MILETENECSTSNSRSDWADARALVAPGNRITTLPCPRRNPATARRGAGPELAGIGEHLEKNVLTRYAPPRAAILVIYNNGVQKAVLYTN